MTDTKLRPTADDIDTAALAIALYGADRAAAVLRTSGDYLWDRQRSCEAVTAALPLARILTPTMNGD